MRLTYGNQRKFINENPELVQKKYIVETLALNKFKTDRYIELETILKLECVKNSDFQIVFND